MNILKAFFFSMGNSANKSQLHKFHYPGLQFSTHGKKYNTTQMLTRQWCTSPCWGLLLNYLARMRQVYTSFVQFLVLKRTLGFSFFIFPPFLFLDGTSKSKAPRRSLQNCKIWRFPKDFKSSRSPYLPGWYWYEVGVTSLGPWYQCW
jgi:hypothetical protein